MDDRCVHELRVAECATCKGVTLESGPPVAVTATFRARYDGGCSTSSEHRIRAGDLAGWTDDDQVVCTACVEDARR